MSSLCYTTHKNVINLHFYADDTQLYVLIKLDIYPWNCLLQRYISAHSMHLNAKYCKAEILNIGPLRYRYTNSDGYNFIVPFPSFESSMFCFFYYYFFDFCNISRVFMMMFLWHCSINPNARILTISKKSTRYINSNSFHWSADLKVLPLIFCLSPCIYSLSLECPRELWTGNNPLTLTFILETVCLMFSVIPKLFRLQEAKKGTCPPPEHDSISKLLFV